MMYDHDLDSFSMNSSNAFFEEGKEVIRYPGKHDVLFGRGGAINQHVGNIMFRKIVNEQKDDYFEAPKCDKPKIARRVVSIIRNLNPPGRFLSPLYEADRNIKDAEGKILWQDVGDKKARAKASQCLREKKIECPNDAPSNQESVMKKRKNTHAPEYRRSHSTFNRIARNADIQANTYMDHQEERIRSIPTPPQLSQRAQKVAKNAVHTVSSYNTGYFNSRWQYTHHSKERMKSCHGQMLAKAVTPSNEGYDRPNMCLKRQKQNIDAACYNREQSRNIGSESGDSWIGSFCSLDTQLIKESESASLSPQMPQINQIPLITPNNENQTLPVVLSTTLWTDTDVGSELTDNSHVGSFE